MDSNPQLGAILYDHMGLVAEKTTASGSPSVDKQALEMVGKSVPAIESLLYMRKLMKARDTYLGNFMKESIDGILHPFFHLHTVQTFRSSSANPNWQNIPKRDPEIQRIVRRAIIPSPGNQLVEIDYSGVEVRISAAYHKDPMMLKYIHDPTTDMHRDMAQECFMLADDEWTKAIRGITKGAFVFAQFYGDYYINCALNLWNAFREHNLMLKGDQVSLQEHLASKGIHSLADFEEHIKKVEDRFWNERFAVYTQWKEAHMEKYRKTGYFDLKTGFRCSGFMKRNEALNYPIQGAAFHCLMRSLIEVNKASKQERWESKLIGQIHDALVLDVKPSELDYVLSRCKTIMCDDLVNKWRWITVPIDIEADVSKIDGSWNEMEPYKIPEIVQ